MSIKRGDFGERQDGGGLGSRALDRTDREIKRGKRKRQGDRSAELARKLMQLKEPLLKKIVMDPELRDTINAARLITAQNARRRSERTLAGELRRWDLVDLSAKLEKVHEAGNIDTRLLHDAESWRARLIEEGSAAGTEFPGGIDDELMRMILAARREKETGKPPGAARALFRVVVKRLQEPPPTSDEDEVDDDESGDEPADDEDDEA